MFESWICTFVYHTLVERSNNSLACVESPMIIPLEVLKVRQNFVNLEMNLCRSSDELLSIPRQNVFRSLDDFFSILRGNFC
jgi:hypothetical protein